MNSSLLREESLSINATNASHEHVHDEWLQDPEYLARIYSVTIINDLLCLMSSVVCLFIILKYYIPIKSIIKPVKYTSILATIFWMLSNIAWVINWHHEGMLHHLTFVKPAISYQIFIYSNICASYAGGMGYAFFLLSFCFRIIHAFKDSMFEVSKCFEMITLSLIVSFCIIFSVLSVLRAMMIGDPVFDYMYSTYVLFSFISYVIVSIIGIRIMVTKLFQFQQFIQNVALKQRNDPQSETVSDLYKVMKRITVLYSFALLSTICVIFLVIFFMAVTIVVYEIYSTDCWSSAPVLTILYTYRTFNIIDSSLNTICLFFQNDIAIPMYNKCCHVCDRNVDKCCCCCPCYNANIDGIAGLSFDVVIK